MAESKRLAVAVLAAGASRRFGDSDKLLANFNGRPLGEHAVAAIPTELFSERWVIAPSQHHPCAEFWAAAGFEVIPNSRSSRGMGTSVALAAYHAMHGECDGLLIALADMPCVPTGHFTALVEAMNGPSDIIASSIGRHGLPPAIFGKEHLERLSRARGDEGARAWLGDGRVIACPHDWLIDIDTQDALERHGHCAHRASRAEPKGEEL